jgi:hypothetical protein
MKRWGIVAAAVLTTSVNAFIPPVSEMLNDIFSGRKNLEAVELVFRHQVQVKEGEFVEVNETFTGTRNQGQISWEIAGQTPTQAEWNGKDYVLRGGKTIPSRTSVFIDYFMLDSGGDYQDRLLRERFIRRDQLLQFKPGYKPEGDPKTWDTKGNTLRHEDIGFKKVGRDSAIEILGLSEGDQRRAVYLATEKKGNARVGKGVAKLEWGVGPEKAAWDFSAFSGFSGLGRLPRVFSLEINGTERVRSTLVSARPVKRDAIFTARTAAKQGSAGAPASGLLEEAIRLIVRYR